MKLGADALLEIVEIVREGLLEGKDISQMLRELDLDTETGDGNELRLSAAYRESKGRL